MIIFLAIPPNQVWVGKQTMRRKPHNNAIIGAFTLKLEIIANEHSLEKQVFDSVFFRNPPVQSSESIFKMRFRQKQVFSPLSALLRFSLNWHVKTGQEHGKIELVQNYVSLCYFRSARLS